MQIPSIIYTLRPVRSLSQVGAIPLLFSTLYMGWNFPELHGNPPLYPWFKTLVSFHVGLTCTSVWDRMFIEEKRPPVEQLAGRPGMKNSETKGSWIKGGEIKSPITMNIYLSMSVAWCLSDIPTRPPCTWLPISTRSISIRIIIYHTVSLIYTLVGILKSSETRGLMIYWVGLFQETTMLRFLSRTFRKFSWIMGVI